MATGSLAVNPPAAWLFQIVFDLVFGSFF